MAMIYTELLLSSRMIQFQPLNDLFSHPKICISKIFQDYPRIFKIPRDSCWVPSRSDEVRREGLQDAPRSACVPGSGAGMRCGNLDTSDTASLCLGSRAHLAWLEPFSKIHIVIYYNYMIYIYILHNSYI